MNRKVLTEVCVDSASPGPAGAQRSDEGVVVLFSPALLDTKATPQGVRMSSYPPLPSAPQLAISGMKRDTA